MSGRPYLTNADNDERETIAQADDPVGSVTPVVQEYAPWGLCSWCGGPRSEEGTGPYCSPGCAAFATLDAAR